MKHIRIFENIQWSDSKLRNVIDDYSNLITLVKKYLKLHNVSNGLRFDVTEIWYPDPKQYVNNKAFPNPPFLCINYKTEDDDKNTFIVTQKEYEDFVLFFTLGPKLYKNSKKYNL